MPSVNVLTLLLRFANIFFVATAPLLWRSNASLLKSTPLLGLGAILVVAWVIYRPAEVPRVLTLAWVSDAASGVLLLGLFGLRLGAPPWVYAAFALALGVGMAGTEVAAMRMAVRSSHPPELRSRLSWFSFTKALGVGSGFLLGGAVAGSPRAAVPARVLVALAGAAIVALAGALALRDLDPAEPAPAGEEGPPLAALAGMVLIALNFVVINLANALVPYRLAQACALPREWIGVLLAVEAYAHAFGTLLFRNGLGPLGDRISYAVGLAGSLALLALLLAFPRCGPLPRVTLLAGLGLTSALSYMASTIRFYACGFPRAIFPRVAVQKLASSSGRAVGSWLAYRAVAWLDPGRS
ncbi:MFS transporter [Mesoterricola silvestris]|uniref:MFS transporter n=1 Tax=Mesoterricola silvestris TaxID=2927979 RepID=A0AA48GKN3_9BACT|nr:hypothetical protein [Mesoterricola silvestris]BDU72969.1 hypothetical protein METEAL_21430 [Mesoterricola silvestris]